MQNQNITLRWPDLMKLAMERRLEKNGVLIEVLGATTSIKTAIKESEESSVTFHEDKSDTR
jgi:hypothetical protein